MGPATLGTAGAAIATAGSNIHGSKNANSFYAALDNLEVNNILYLKVNDTLTDANPSDKERV